MHELPLSLSLSLVLSSGNLTFVVRTGLKRLREKTEGSQERSLLLIQAPRQLCSKRRVALVSERKRVRMEYYDSAAVTLQGV